MKQLKIWAKKYLVHSPLFRSNLFGQPHQQKLMRINPQLLSAYTLAMFKKYHYDHQKVLSVLKDYYPQQHHYSVQAVRELLNPSQTQESINDPERRYRVLVFQLFQKNIKLKQFKELAQLYVTLKQSDKLRQFDDFVLDQSFYQIYQLTIFCQLGYSAAIEAIGTESIKLLEKRLEKTYLVGIYGLFIILNRLKDKINEHPSLSPYSAWLQPRADFNKILKENQHCRVFLLRQSLSYMLWLLRMNELGKVVEKYTKQNYVYNSYIQNSLETIGSLLQLFEENHQLSIHELVVLNQVVYEIQNIQQTTFLFEDVKRNIALELLLLKIKTNINNELVKHGEEHRSQLEHFEWLEKVNMFPIEYISYTTRTYLKTKMESLLNHSHLSILLNNRQLATLIELCRKIDHYALAAKFEEKIKQNKTNNPQQANILGMLEEYYANGTKRKYVIEIANIYELKRIKIILQRLKIKEKKHPQFTTQQISIFISLQEELNTSDDSSPRAELKPLFNLFLR